MTALKIPKAILIMNKGSIIRGATPGGSLEWESAGRLSPFNILNNANPFIRFYENKLELAFIVLLPVFL